MAKRHRDPEAVPATVAFMTTEESDRRTREIDSWFPEFWSLHQGYNSRSNWELYAPDTAKGRPLIEGLKYHFARRGVRKDEAVEASKRLMTEEDAQFVDAHPRLLLKHVEAIWAERHAAAAASVSPSAVGNVDRDTATRLSSGCPECEGNGYSTRLFAVGERGEVYSVALFCRCALGQWISGYYRAKYPDQWRRMLDLQCHPQLWHGELTHPSWSWDHKIGPNLAVSSEGSRGFLPARTFGDPTGEMSPEAWEKMSRRTREVVESFRTAPQGYYERLLGGTAEGRVAEGPRPVF